MSRPFAIIAKDRVCGGHAPAHLQDNAATPDS